MLYPTFLVVFLKVYSMQEIISRHDLMKGSVGFFLAYFKIIFSLLQKNMNSKPEVLTE